MATRRDPRNHHRRRDRHRRAIARNQPDCALCGLPIDYTLPTPHPMSYEVDHIVPIAQGGADNLHNKQAAHRRCNRAASDKRPKRAAVWFITTRTWTTDSTTGSATFA